MRERVRAFANAAILEAAETVFAEQGLDAGMDAIAARAGVAVGTLYKHFTDRDGLIQALLDARFAELLAAMDAASRWTLGQGFETQLVATLVTVAEHTQLHAAFRRTALQVELPARHPHRVALRALILERLAVVLQRGRESGALRSDPDDLQPVLLLGLLHSMLVLSDQGGRSPSAIAALVARQFIHGAGA